MSEVPTSPDPHPDRRSNALRSPAGLIGWSIFASRWLQAPLYVGLIVAQVVYVVKFWKKLSEMVVDFPHLSENEIMLAVLGLVDVVMIANLLIMVIIGGYETFVSRIRQVSDHPDQPEWLSHVNANVLKVKLAMAIVGISSIHLLKTFIEFGDPKSAIGTTEVLWQTLIHLTFVVSAVALAFIDRFLSTPPGQAHAAKAPVAEPAPDQPDPQADGHLPELPGPEPAPARA
ncbi:MAG: TIGR00645 family protein [Solirubrobacterales bacterium]|nr:TIGR00645 family protein [Solirubrobacterales bacterium]